MSDKLSIDEILKQAEMVREKSEERLKSKQLEEEKKRQEALEKTRVIPAQNEEKTIAIDTKKINDAELKQNTLDEKTNVIPKVESVKKSHFKSKSSEGQYDKNPPEIIERPAIIKSKSKFDHTLDLHEVPTIVAVEELENTMIMGARENDDVPSSKQNDTDEDGQIKLSGFDDKIDNVSTIDEEEAEKMLKQRRKDKVGKFRVNSPNIIDAPSEETTIDEDKPAEKYDTAEERKDIMRGLLKKRKVFTSRAIFSSVIGVVIFLMTIFKDTAYIPSALSEYNTYFIVMIVLFGIVMLANIKTIIGGFASIFKRGGPDSEFFISISTIVVMVQTCLMLAMPEFFVSNGEILVPVAVFALIVDSLGKHTLLSRIIKNFKFVISDEEKYTVENIGNPVDATIISRGLLLGDPVLKNSIKTDNPKNFIEISYASEPAEKINKKISFIFLPLAIILFVVISLITKDWKTAFNCTVAAIAISTPVMSLYTTNSVLNSVSKRLKKSGAMVCGFEGAQYVDDANAMVIEASSLFRKQDCYLHGIKTFNNAKIDDAILQTAAVIIKSKSPLAGVFDDVIVGKKAILPKADDVVYEDKMGTSAWIYGKKVLVGNRNLLINHGISVPKSEFENKYTRNGRKALYLAVAGKTLAMFVVSYSANEDLRQQLLKLEKSGITILVKTNDPFINDESLVELFGLPEGYLRVMNASSGRVYDKYSGVSVNESPAYIVHDGTALGFVSSMAGANSLLHTKSLIGVLVTFGSAIGFGVVTLLSLIGGYSQLTATNIIICQTIWSILILLITKNRRV